MAVIVYEKALTDINYSDLFSSDTVPYDWGECGFEDDGASSDTHAHSSSKGKAAIKLKEGAQAFKKFITAVPQRIHQALTGTISS